MKSLSIIIPVYNEENTIPKLIEQLPKHESIETIIVDDHSTDHSLELLRKAKSKMLKFSMILL